MTPAAANLIFLGTSPPSRRSGLKSAVNKGRFSVAKVSALAAEWIEMEGPEPDITMQYCLRPRGGVD